MADNRNKQVEFLRMMLKYYGFEWNIVKMSINPKIQGMSSDIIKCKYSAIFNNKIVYTVVFTMNLDDFSKLSLNDLDVKYCCSDTLVYLITKDRLNISEEYYRDLHNKLHECINFYGPEFKIDYVLLMENLILDGVDLSEFPSIEEVL